MAKGSNNPAGSFETENTGGLLTGFLAEEDEFDRRALWRIGSWGVGAVAAVTVAVVTNQTALGWRRDQVAAADLAWQAQQLQTSARENHNEARRLAAAIDTLNSDRDRLYSRVTTLELGLDSVTGAIARQSPVGTTTPATAESKPTPIQPSAPTVATVATTRATPPPPERPLVPEKPQVTEKPAAAEKPSSEKIAASEKAAAAEKPAATASAETSAPPSASQETAKPQAAAPSTPLVTAKSMMAPPDPAAGKLIEPAKPASPVSATTIPEVVASVPVVADADEDAEVAKVPIQRTEFGVDLGSANSLGGLRALWRGLLKSRSNAQLSALRPIIVVREGNSGLGLQLRLVAGPLNDAGAAANICAVLAENNRACETTIFDGQRLMMKAEETAPAAAKPASRRRGATRHAPVVEAPKQEISTLSSVFTRRTQ